MCACTYSNTHTFIQELGEEEETIGEREEKTKERKEEDNSMYTQNSTESSDLLT